MSHTGSKHNFFFFFSWPGAVKKNSQGRVVDKERSEKLLPYPTEFCRQKLYTLLAVSIDRGKHFDTANWDNIIGKKVRKIFM